MSHIAPRRPQPQPHQPQPHRLCNPNLTRRSFLGATAALAATSALGLPALSGCRSVAGDAIIKGERTIVDDAGREIVIPTPENIKRVYFTSGLAQVFILTLAPDLMGATCSKYDANDMKYLPKELQGLTYLGAVETGEMDVEAVMAHGIQLIFSISSVELTEANISEAIDIQEMSGIPTVLIDGSFERIADAYAMLGDILGRQERADELCAYCERVFAEVHEAVKDIPEEEKVTVYYAEGPLGLQTEPETSQHALTFVEAGAKDVAQVELLDATGMADVSLESVIKWNPEVIVTWDEELRGGANKRIMTHEDWATIKAVRTGRVYTMPNVPIAWVDRPMACNRYLGLQWVANMLYPDRYPVDMVERGKEFYQLFYGVEVSDEDMRGFLGNSYPPYQPEE